MMSHFLDPVIHKINSTLARADASYKMTTLRKVTIKKLNGEFRVKPVPLDVEWLFKCAYLGSKGQIICCFESFGGAVGGEIAHIELPLAQALDFLSGFQEAVAAHVSVDIESDIADAKKQFVIAEKNRKIAEAIEDKAAATQALIETEALQEESPLWGTF